MHSLAIDDLGNELQTLGVEGRDRRCLLLLPQIYVGWASPSRDPHALEALLERTARNAHLPHECRVLARGWLLERPTPTQFASGFALLRLLRRARDAALIASSDVLQAMLWAVRVAHLIYRAAPDSTRRALRHAEVQRALDELETWLELDTRHLWIDLFTEAPPAEALAPAAARSLAAASPAELERAAETSDAGADDEHSALLLIRPKPAGPASAPFPLTRRLA